MPGQMVRAGLSSWTQELILLFGGGFCLVSGLVLGNCQDDIDHAENYSDYKVTEEPCFSKADYQSSKAVYTSIQPSATTDLNDNV